MTKYLISKCRENGNPIYAYIDTDECDYYNRKQKLTELRDVMYNIVDGMDGFFISFKDSTLDAVPDYNKHISLLNDIIDYYKSIQEDTETIEQLHR